MRSALLSVRGLKNEVYSCVVRLFRHRQPKLASLESV